MSRQDVEIAIPACNEENTIATTIASFRSQDYSPALRIVVCANGCTDGTVDVVRRLQNSDRNLILDVTSERGKPNAWNRLREMTTAPYICFADGDVIVPPTSISRMMQHLETNSILAAVGARVVPVTDGASWTQRVAAPPAVSIPGLCGRLYLCRRVGLEERMIARGYPAMPKSVIHEDRWITYVIGRGLWEEALGATVLYVPPTWADLLRLFRRHARGMRQFRQHWLELYEDQKSSRTEYLSWLARGFLEGNTSHLGYGGMALGYVVRRIISLVARLQVAMEVERSGLSG